MGQAQGLRPIALIRAAGVCGVAGSRALQYSSSVGAFICVLVNQMVPLPSGCAYPQSLKFAYLKRLIHRFWGIVQVAHSNNFFAQDVFRCGFEFIKIVQNTEAVFLYSIIHDL